MCMYNYSCISLKCVCVCVHLGVYAVSDPVSLMLSQVWIVMHRHAKHGKCTPPRGERSSASKISRHYGSGTAPETTLPAPILAAAGCCCRFPWYGMGAGSPGDSCRCHSTAPRPMQSIASEESNISKDKAENLLKPTARPKTRLSLGRTIKNRLKKSLKNLQKSQWIRNKSDVGHLVLVSLPRSFQSSHITRVRPGYAGDWGKTDPASPITTFYGIATAKIKWFGCGWLFLVLLTLHFTLHNITFHITFHIT